MKNDYSNEEVRAVACPECGTAANELCLGVFRHQGQYAGRRKPRVTSHIGRINDYAYYLQALKDINI